MSCTDNDIVSCRLPSHLQHIEYFTTQHSDLRKVDQLVQWFVSKMASDLPTDQRCAAFLCSCVVVKMIRADIEEEKLKRSGAKQ